MGKNEGENHLKKSYLFDENSVLYKIKSIHAADIYRLEKKYEFRTNTT